MGCLYPTETWTSVCAVCKWTRDWAFERWRSNFQEVGFGAMWLMLASLYSSGASPHLESREI